MIPFHSSILRALFFVVVREGAVQYRVGQKKLAKFSDTCSVKLYIGCPRLVGGRKAGNSNVHELFCTTLYSTHHVSSFDKCARKTLAKRGHALKDRGEYPLPIGGHT